MIRSVLNISCLFIADFAEAKNNSFSKSPNMSKPPKRKGSSSSSESTANKRKCTFTDDLRREFASSFCNGKSECFAHCIVCDKEVSVANSGLYCFLLVESFFFVYCFCI